MPTMGRELNQESSSVCRLPLGPLARYLSTTTLVRNGPTTSHPALIRIATSASNVCHLYGTRYLSSRFISRLSYALPSTSSSWCESAMRGQSILDGGGERRSENRFSGTRKNGRIF